MEGNFWQPDLPDLLQRRAFDDNIELFKINDIAFIVNHLSGTRAAIA